MSAVYTLDSVAASLTLRVNRGDEWAVGVRFTRRGYEQPINVDGYRLICEVRLHGDRYLVVSPDVEIVDPENGVVRLSLTEAQTFELDAGSYRYSLRWVAPGEVERTILRGIMEVVER
jgi:hypothetical protein